MRDWECEASSTWTDTQGDDACNFMGRGRRAVRKQLENVIGPCINKERMRGWDHYLVILRVVEEEKITDREEARAGRVEARWREGDILGPEESKDEFTRAGKDGLTEFQEKLGKAVHGVKGMTRAIRQGRTHKGSQRNVEQRSVEIRCLKNCQGRVARKAMRQCERTVGVSARSITITKRSNSLTYTVASSLVCTSPLAVITVVGLLDVLMVSNSAELRSFLLTICILAPESTKNSLSSSFYGGCGRHMSLYMFLARFHALLRAHRCCLSISS